MSRRLCLSLSLLSLAVLAACAGTQTVAEFWRPISEPNLQMSLERVQMKLEFDLSQCHCGIFPTNVPQTDLIAYEPDMQRLAETSITSTKDEEGSCIQRPSLVVAECMRSRGWEVTKCSGRMPTAGGGAVCTATVLGEN